MALKKYTVSTRLVKRLGDDPNGEILEIIEDGTTVYQKPMLPGIDIGFPSAPSMLPTGPGFTPGNGQPMLPTEVK